MQHADAFSRYPVEDPPAADSEGEMESERERVWRIKSFEDSVAMVQSREHGKSAV